jgi:hypothetical protein
MACRKGFLGINPGDRFASKLGFACLPGEGIASTAATAQGSLRQLSDLNDDLHLLRDATCIAAAQFASSACDRPR